MKKIFFIGAMTLSLVCFFFLGVGVSFSFVNYLDKNNIEISSNESEDIDIALEDDNSNILYSRYSTIVDRVNSTSDEPIFIYNEDAVDEYKYTVDIDVLSKYFTDNAINNLKTMVKEVDGIYYDNGTLINYFNNSVFCDIDSSNYSVVLKDTVTSLFKIDDKYIVFKRSNNTWLVEAFD